MKTSFLISTCRQLYLADTSSVDADRLWSDAGLAFHLSQAQNEAANRALLLRDFTTPRICNITLVENQVHYPLDKRILKIVHVYYQRSDGTLIDLPPISRGEADALFGLEWRTFVGEPAAYIPDGHDIRLYPIPTAEYAGLTLILDVYRYPLAVLVSGFSSTLASGASSGALAVTLHTGDGALLPAIGEDQEIHLDSSAGTIIVTAINGDTLTTLPLPGALLTGATVTADSEPEIDASMHRALLYWVAHEALTLRDADVPTGGGNMNVFLAKFEQQFGPPRSHAARMNNLNAPGTFRTRGMNVPSFRYGSGRRVF